MADQNEFVQALCPQCRDGYDEKEMLCDSLAVLAQAIGRDTREHW